MSTPSTRVSSKASGAGITRKLTKKSGTDPIFYWGLSPFPIRLAALFLVNELPLARRRAHGHDARRVEDGEHHAGAHLCVVALDAVERLDVHRIELAGLAAHHDFRVP